MFSSDTLVLAFVIGAFCGFQSQLENGSFMYHHFSTVLFTLGSIDGRFTQDFGTTVLLSVVYILHRNFSTVPSLRLRRLTVAKYVKEDLINFHLDSETVTDRQVL